MAILNNSNAISPSGYDVNNSLRFRQSASAYLSRTPGSNGSLRTWTASFWYKNGVIDNNQTLFSNATASDSIGFRSSRTIEVYFGAGSANLVTTQVFRDVAAWYHIVVAVDTTQATAANRIKLYVNGSQVTAFSTSTYPSQNYDTSFNKASTAQNIGRRASNSDLFLDGYMAEVNWIDGQALTPSDFGSTDATTGVWKPKAYTGTYGTNGFYLKFSDIATTSGSNAGLGKDFSGNTNYWTTNNISVTSGTTYDAMTDVPTNTSPTVANYAVLNPLQSSATLSFANLQAASSTSGWKPTIASMAMTSGKWYAEFTVGFADANNGMHVGIVGENFPFASGNYIGQSSTSYGYRSYNGYKYNNGANSAYGASFTTGDVIGIALDLDAGTITFYKNNTSQGTAYTGLAGVYFFAVSFEYTTSSPSGNFNFGQRPFSYTPPSGFVALNTYNLPTPTILQGNKYMDATLYTGNGATRSITNDGSFKPDFVWIKARSIAYFHRLADSVRGTGKELYSNDTGAETTNQADGYVSAFNSNGFSILGGAGVNLNANTYAAWQWQAGQGSTSSNTNGTITSTVSVNTTAGFSIVKFTSQASGTGTVGHGLGVAPKFIITKLITDTSGANWNVYHASIGNTGIVNLNTTGATTTNSQYWNNTTPTSNVFTVGTWYAGSLSTIAYCWAEIAGFSKFGSYTGNGSSDGPFVFTGFRPKFVMVKNSSIGTEGWRMWDSSRSDTNVVDETLEANSSGAEFSTASLDFVSNGFKIRNTSSPYNGNGNTMIYMAFAESPFSTNNRAR